MGMNVSRFRSSHVMKDESSNEHTICGQHASLAFWCLDLVRLRNGTFCPESF